MDMQAIQEAITTLENANTTFDNVQELSCLYIVRDNMNTQRTANGIDVEAQLNDILPSYDKYIAVKRKYQMGETQKEAVIKALECLCAEINEFMTSLYSSLDFPKEKYILQNSIEKISALFN